jgi:hypothetical protein
MNFSSIYYIRINFLWELIYFFFIRGRSQVVMALIGWATHVLQWYLQTEATMQISANLIKNILVRIAGCNSPCMKLESLVIMDQHAMVNAFKPCTHRPSHQGNNHDLKY